MTLKEPVVFINSQKKAKYFDKKSSNSNSFCLCLNFWRFNVTFLQSNTSMRREINETNLKEDFTKTSLKQDVNKTSLKDNINNTMLKDGINNTKLKDDINKTSLKEDTNKTSLKDDIDLSLRLYDEDIVKLQIMMECKR